MKLAIVKFGGRMHANGNGPIDGEVMAAVDLFVKGNNEVHYYTKILDKDIPLKGAVGHNFEEFENGKHNALIIINGNINFFGGQEPKVDMQTLKLVNLFQGPVFYILFDPLLPLRQHWKGIENKQEKYNWENRYIKEEIEITRKDIICISQPYNIDAVKKILEKSEIQFKDVIHYPLHKMHLVYYDRLEKIVPLEERENHLAFGGTFRSGRREDKLIKYYFGYPEDTKVELFGKFKLKQFNTNKYKDLRPPTFGENYKHYDVPEKMSKSVATVVIGDKWYEGNNLAQRVYENILSNTVTFIDKELDPLGKVYEKNETIKNFLWVENRDDVIKNVRNIMMHQDDGLKAVLDAQYEVVKIDKKQYINDLSSLIKENL